jgi:hypothetical protein
MRDLNQTTLYPSSLWLRHGFGMAFPALNGNNCLLTRDFAFIDLFFFSLLA